MLLSISSLSIAAFLCIITTQAASVPRATSPAAISRPYAPLHRRQGGRSLVDMSSPKCAPSNGGHLNNSQIITVASNFNDQAGYYWYQGAVKNTQPGGLNQAQFSFVLDAKGNIQLMAYDRQAGSTLPKELVIELVFAKPTKSTGWLINMEKSNTCHVSTDLKLKDVKGITVKQK